MSSRFSSHDNFLGVYSYDELVSRGQRFDCVFVVELLEDLDDISLDKTPKGLHRLVYPDCRIFITTPNREVFSESYLVCPSCEQVFHRWQHVRSWSRETLKPVLEAHGFEVVEAFSTDFSKVTGRWEAFRRRYLSRGKPDKKRPHLVVICPLFQPRDSAV